MKKRILIFLIYFLPIPVILVSLLIGPAQSVSPKSVLTFFLEFIRHSGINDSNSEFIRSVVIDVRLPRVLLAFLVGGAFSISGCGLQAIFRNPLTDPYILGLSSGAAFGAALALAYSLIPVQVSSFLFGLVAVGLSYFMARKHKKVSVVSLILAGIIVSGIFTALLTIVQFLTDPFKLQTIIHWTMGNLHNANWTRFNSAAIPIMLGCVILVLYRWRINVLSLGDDEAKTVGLNPDRDKLLVLFAATLASASSVAVAGIIGLYGLIIPHMVRMMLGPDNRLNMPANFLFGGMFLLIIDDFSRALLSFEMPIGVFTILLGAPFFIYLMKKTQIVWNH
ncbi:MAG: iron ABC transporter permease [Bacteroidales bacterium]